MSSEPKQPQQPQQGPQRDASGRFVVGHAGGPGRPPASRETAYLRLLRQSCPPEKFAEAAAEILAIALDKKSKPADRVKAFAALSQHVLPTQRDRYDVEISLHDPRETNEFRIAGRTPSEVDSYVAEHLRKLLIEQASYERSLRQHRQALGHCQPETNTGGPQP